MGNCITNSMCGRGEWWSRQAAQTLQTALLDRFPQLLHIFNVSNRQKAQLGACMYVVQAANLVSGRVLQQDSRTALLKHLLINRLT